MNLLILLLLLNQTTTMTISSAAFSNNADIPSKYTCEDQGINPPLNFGNIPNGAKTLALIVDDPDAPKGTFDHWVVYNIPPTTTYIEESSKPGMEGKNGKGEIGYTGPCPPNGKHHYHFKVYALDTRLKLAAGASKAKVLDAMNGHILATGELIGLYQKQK